MAPVGERRVLHRGTKFDLESVAWPAPEGGTHQRDVVRHPGAVTICPILETDGRPPQIVLIRNFRIACEQELWELPAGTLEPPEPPADCAARELEEETGYRAASLTPVAAFYTTPGMTDERMHAFVATALTPSRQALEEGEQIRVEPRTVPEVFAMIDDNRLADAKSILTILIAQRQGLIPDAP
jgi:ADP-ribose pyrophosphatase